MAKKKKARDQKDAETPISTLIDVVFLLIIFFVVTASLDKEVEDEKVRLCNSPHGKVVAKKSPDTFTINIHKDGKAYIAGNLVTPRDITNRLYAHSQSIGKKDFPILIRADKEVKHGHIMDVETGITDSSRFAIMFNAQKEE